MEKEIEFSVQSEKTVYLGGLYDPTINLMPGDKIRVTIIRPDPPKATAGVLIARKYYFNADSCLAADVDAAIAQAKREARDECGRIVMDRIPIAGADVCAAIRALNTENP